MDPSTANLAATAWGVASALAVTVLGSLMLAGGRSRPWGAVAFGLFAVVWGAQVAFANLTRITTDATISTKLHLTSLACLIVMPYFLVEFAASQVGEERKHPPWMVLRAGAAGLALLNATIMLAAPELLFRGVIVDEHTIQPLRGALQVPLVSAPLFATMGLALFVLNRQRSAAPTPRVRTRALVLLAGLGLYVGFAAGNNLGYYATWVVSLPAGASTVALTMLFLALTALALFIGVSCLRDARRHALAHEARGERLAAIAILTPLAWGLGEGVVAFFLSPLFDTVGLWRLAGVGVIAYGLAQWRVLDLPQRARNATATGVGVATAVAGGAATYGTASLALSGPVASGLAGLAVFAVALVPGVRLARRLWSARVRERTPRSDYGQRIDAYRAALEASVARGTLDDDASFLGALRERFGISEDAHEVLLHLAHGAVLLPREQGVTRVHERLRLLGEGGGGRTWLARDRSRDRLVVLKEPLERWHKRSEISRHVVREARLAARVRHPNVVRIEEVVEEDGLPVIVMEYVEGGSLEDLLDHRGVMAWPDAVKLAQGMLAGLEAVHAAGIVHRDIKPANILLTLEGVPKLGDFGIATSTLQQRTVIDARESDRSGTPTYMAPEVLAGRAGGDRCSDVYAAGLVLHEAVHGAPRGGRDVVLLQTDVPPALSIVIARATAQDPEHRYPTARAFAQALAEVDAS